MSRVAAPTVAQLLVLADRAERGRLSAAEAARLRVGLGVLESAARDASAEARRQRALVGVLRGQLRDSAAPGVERTVAMARRWLHIPAKRAAGAAVLASLANTERRDAA